MGAVRVSCFGGLVRRVACDVDELLVWHGWAGVVGSCCFVGPGLVGGACHLEHLGGQDLELGV
eukprot:9055646-Prorocentrum_lima.AAC.1